MSTAKLRLSPPDTARGAKIELDGVEQKGVVQLDLHVDATDVPRATIQYLVEIEVRELETEVVKLATVWAEHDGLRLGAVKHEGEPFSTALFRLGIEFQKNGL